MFKAPFESLAEKVPMALVDSKFSEFEGCKDRLQWPHKKKA